VVVATKKSILNFRELERCSILSASLKNFHSIRNIVDFMFVGNNIGLQKFKFFIRIFKFLLPKNISMCDILLAFFKFAYKKCYE
jgi:hypothetical protein